MPTITILRSVSHCAASSADARLAGGECRVVLHPELAVAGPDEHDVAFADLDALCLRGCFEIARRDDLTDFHSLDASGLRHVEQHSASEEHADVLDAELLQSVGRAELRAPEAVVKVIVAVDPNADVTQAVELGADLADLAAEEIVVIDALDSCRWARRSASRESSS